MARSSRCYSLILERDGRWQSPHGGVEVGTFSRLHLFVVEVDERVTRLRMENETLSGFRIYCCSLCSYRVCKIDKKHNVLSQAELCRFPQHTLIVLSDLSVTTDTDPRYWYKERQQLSPARFRNIGKVK